MTLPVSKYEELLETVRNLKQQTIRVRELASPLLDTIISANITGETNSFHFHHQLYQDENKDVSLNYSLYEDANYYCCHTRSVSAMESLLMERQHQQFDVEDGAAAAAAAVAAVGISVSSSSSNSEPRDKYHHIHHDNMWHSEPSPLHFVKRHRNENNLSPHDSVSPTDMTSVMSFASSSGAAVPFGMCLNTSDLVTSSEGEGEDARQRQQQLDVKVEMVYSLLAVLGTSECPDMGETLLALSSSPDSSRAMRQAGCLSILVQLVHAKDDENAKTRDKASQALRNLVQGQTDEKQKKRELKILKLLEDIRTHCNKTPNEHDAASNADDAAAADDYHPTQATENIIKLSFDEGYRHTICELGGIFTLARLIEMEHSRHGSLPTSDKCVTLRRYAGMALTNLTFGHGRNKSLLCSFNVFMRCLVAQLGSTTDELRQVTASVLRNLSWRADGASRAALRDAGAVTALMHAAMKSRREATLKSVLSALWNLSAHCSTNKADICAVPGALAFLVDMLGFRPPSTTLTIIENAGGILRNVSSHIAIRDDYRTILRDKGCLPLLLQQLKSPSLTVVSNACGTLWNLSAKCEQDQRALWEMGAAPMLRSLNHSKHAMIATGSRAALKNLLSSRPAHNLFNHMDATAREMGLPTLPTLGARKQRALAKDLDQNLSETCDNIEPTSPPPPSPPQLLSPTITTTTTVTTATSITCNNTSRRQKVDTQHLVESFASLNLTKIEDIPIRSKLSDYTFKYDQDEEEPIDYSQKYAENKTNVKAATTIVAAADISPQTTTTRETRETIETTEIKETNATNYSDYAETDLDQPTNYSLRYAENDSDSDIIQDEEQFDTVKTYCTEGTPLNFSTATSMSDLRQIDSTSTEEKDKDKEKKKSIPKYHRKECVVKKVSECTNSGLMTPEKPVKYCEEGTPRSFSRHSSFSSLNIDDSQNIKQIHTHEEGKDECEDLNEIQVENEIENEEKAAISTDKTDTNVNISGVGVVIPTGTSTSSTGIGIGVGTGTGTGTGAEETPLMFSRCSSLCSVSSAEQHSIHDDRSSIISDFSRLTSGIVSPSELPDSPTQTVPPSPRQRRAPIDFTVKAPTQHSHHYQLQPQPQPHPHPQLQINQAKSVFEDNVIKFKQARTPIEFSANTSLSSLTIDDELPANINFNLLAGAILGTTDNTQNTPVTTTTTTTAVTTETTHPINNKDVDEQEEDDMLAACINIGIQNNRHREKKQLKQPSVKLSRLHTSRTGIPMIKTAAPKAPPLPEMDSTRVYCTEDTPAMLSHAGSQSDLSLLSVESSANRRKMPNDDKQNCLDLSDDSSNLSGDNESNILAECIQSGMPKAKGQPPKIHPPRIAAIGARDEMETYAVEDSPCQFSLRSSLSDLTIDGVKSVKKPAQPAAVLSRAESLSSLSVESFGSTENADQVLLEQCISSGMPAKNNKPNTLASSSSSSKNVQATSVAPDLEWTDETIKKEYVNIETENPTMKIGFNSSIIEKFTSWPQQDEHNLLNTEMIIKNNHDNIDKCSDLLDGSIEDNCYENNYTNCKSVDNRMLDPDAMIESLDRFTAELVSQSSHLQQSSYGNGNGNGNDTWNEDTSPNDISFPSISISAPLVASFNSEDATDIDAPDKEKETQPDSLDTTSTMTDSTLIAIEAANIVNHVQNDHLEMQESITSLDLEHVKPPSVMDSIISLTSSVSDSPKICSPLAARKRSLPIGNLMMRRALSNTNKNSYENLNQIQDGPNSISSCSNLDYMKPPSVMGDFLDLVDMENSMISVASITSETTDDNEDKQYFMTAADDTLFQDCYTHTIAADQTLDDVTLTEYSDANSVTPVPSDFASSSAESTPKKERSICMRMTPKQRRQYAKDRYKTYTVAAEMVIRQVSDTDTDINTNSNERQHKLTPKERRQLDRDRFQTRVLDVNVIQQQVETNDADIKQINKQRRLENKERFRTQTLSSGNDSEQEDLHLLLAQQANIVLDTLHADELLDCETLSLVSNDDESELNSVSSINYRTYHKSWGFSKNLPVVHTTQPPLEQTVEAEHISVSDTDETQPIPPITPNSNDKIAKIPKIIKPNETSTPDEKIIEDEIKAIRGKRKPLYSTNKTKTIPTSTLTSTTTITSTPTKSPIKSIKQPFRTMTSNLVKNVTTTIKSQTTRNKSATTATIANKPPLAANKLNVVRSNTTPFKSHSNVVKNTPTTTTQKLPEKQNKHELLKNRSSSNGSIPLNSKPLERQGTFTKDNNKKPPSKIPESKIPTNKFRSSVSSIQSRTVSSTTGARGANRSPSTDRSSTSDFGFRAARRSPNTQIHQSNSTQSLQGANDAHHHHFTVKRSSNPDICTNTIESTSATTTTTTTPTAKRKPVASRIASLWKKSHSDVGVNDKKSIATTATTTTTNTTTNVKMRKKNNISNEINTKRLSRLGSFIKVDEISVT